MTRILVQYFLLPSASVDLEFLPPPNTSLIILGPLPSLSHFYEFELLEYRSLRALSVVFTKFLAPSKYSVIIINEYVNHSLSLASSVSIQMLSS